MTPRSRCRRAQPRPRSTRWSRGSTFAARRRRSARSGRKALAAALSDLAAMGAAPGEAYVQLGVPGRPRRGGLPRARRGARRRWPPSTMSPSLGGDVTRAPALELGDHRRRPRRLGRGAGAPRGRPPRRRRWRSPGSSAGRRRGCCSSSARSSRRPSGRRSPMRCAAASSSREPRLRAGRALAAARGERDDRPQRRARRRRRPHRRGERRAAGDRAGAAAGAARGRARWRPPRGWTPTSWRRAAARTTSCSSPCRPSVSTRRAPRWRRRARR